MSTSPESPTLKSLQRWQALTAENKTPDGRMNFVPGTAVKIRYTNWQGVTGERLILPQEVVFGENEYHKGPQWLLNGFDLGKQAMRTFAMTDIHVWESLPDVKPGNLDEALAALKA